MSVIFNQVAENILSGVLDLSTPADYYLHLVTTIPSANSMTVADLVITDATGYQPQPLSGQTFDNNILNFNGVTFSAMTASVNIVGSVLCKRIGSSFADTDLVICFSETNNAIGNSIEVKPELEKIIIDFGTNGAIKINDLYGYQSGSFSGVFPDTNGLFYLIGTNNNTAAFFNPAPDKINVLTPLDQSRAANATDRNSGTNIDAFGNIIAFDFYGQNGNDAVRKLKIKPLEMYLQGDNAGFSSSISIYGSNNLPSFENSFLVSGNGYWEPLAFSQPFAQLIALNTSTYYRWLMITSSSYGRFTEIEFYNSVISSNVQNLI